MTGMVTKSSVLCLIQPLQPLAPKITRAWRSETQVSDSPIGTILDAPSSPNSRSLLLKDGQTLCIRFVMQMEAAKATTSFFSSLWFSELFSCWISWLLSNLTTSISPLKRWKSRNSKKSKIQRLQKKKASSCGYKLKKSSPLIYQLTIL